MLCVKLTFIKELWQLLHSLNVVLADFSIFCNFWIL